MHLTNEFALRQSVAMSLCMPGVKSRTLKSINFTDHALPGKYLDGWPDRLWAGNQSPRSTQPSIPPG